MSFALNEALSWEARGLLSHLLLTTPDDFVVGDIVKSSPAGRDKVSSILSELVRSGHIYRWKERDFNGQWVWRSKVFACPVVGETWISGYFENGGSQIGGCHDF